MEAMSGLFPPVFGCPKREDPYRVYGNRQSRLENPTAKLRFESDYTSELRKIEETRS